MSSLRTASTAIAAATVLAVACPASFATDPGSWDTRFAGSGIDRTVFALAPTGDGGLLIGGAFGGTPGTAKAVTIWRDGQWSTLGAAPDDGVSGQVYAAATIGANTFIGGEFGADNRGGILNSIARWDGAALHPLGNGPVAGVAGSVYALAVEGTDLIAAGRFRHLGALPGTNIARWNGSTWSAFGTGLGDGDNDRISALAIAPGGVIYAGGNFVVAGKKVVRRLARWDGSQWTEVGGGANGWVEALAWHDGQLFVGGVFDQVGTNKIANLARWDGTNWFALGTGVDGEVKVLASLEGKLHVGGGFTKAGGIVANSLAIWDGSNWNTAGGRFTAGGSSEVNSLVLHRGRLIAGGSFHQAGGVVAPNVAAWDGARWHSLESGFAGGESPRVTALDAHGGNITVGGVFNAAGGLPVNRVAQWDGAGWHALGGGFDQPPLALAHGPSGELYAGGAFATGGRRIARWNGTSWSSLGGGVTSEGSVWSIAVATNGDVYAGGIFTEVGGVNAPGIARWNGQTWSALDAGISNYGSGGMVLALAFVGDELYAGGVFNSAGGVAVNNLARWNGTAWSDAGSGVSIPGFQATVHALAPFGSGLLVGGDFNLANQNAFPFLAAWKPDTGTWNQLGGAPNGTVRAIATLDGRMHVGGDFTRIAGVEAPGLARWDGASWSSVGGSLGGDQPWANQLSADGTNLWVAGPFTRAGGQRASDLARWWVPANAAPSVSFISPADHTSFAADTPIPLLLSASDPEGSPIHLELRQNGLPLATLNGPPFEFTWRDVFPDTYVLEAVAIDDAGQRSPPALRTLTVAPPAGDLPPTVSIPPPNGGTVFVGEPFNLAAAAGDPDGQVIRVDFLRDDLPLGSADATPFQVHVPGLPAGTFQLRAIAVDNLGAKATSAPVTLQVVSGTPPAVRWKFRSSANVLGSVAIDPNGLIYVGLGPGFDNLACLRPNGSVAWVYRDNGAFLGSPAIGRNGDILAGRFDGRLLCVGSDGRRRWEFETGQPIRSAPAIARDGTIYFGSDNQTLYALDPDGKKLWSYAAGAASDRSAPAIAADGAILFGTTDGRLHCLNPSGTERWNRSVPGTIATSPAIADDGTIYVVSSVGVLFAVDPDSTPRWEYKSVSSSLGSSPVIGPDGTVYFGTSDGNLHAVASDGTRKWAYKTDDAISGTPAVDRDGTILVASNDRKLHAVFSNGLRKWVFTTESLSGASVAIATDGTILVGSSDQYLYALSGTAPLSDSQWPKFHRDLAQTGRATRLPAVGLVKPVDGADFVTSESIRFEANASSSNGPVAYVEFRVGDTVLGRSETAPFKFDWTHPPAGVFRVQARVVDSAGASALSSSARILVSAPGTPPTITKSPQPASTGPGQTVSLAVEARSASPVAYQWSKDGRALPGATAATLSLEPTTADMSGWYSVIARNPYGSITSAPVLVTVLLPPRVFWTRDDGNGSSGPPSIGPSGNLYTSARPGGIRCHDRPGTLIWANTGISPSTGIAVAHDGTLYFGTGTGQLVSMTGDGRIRWSVPASGRVNGIAFQGDSTVYATTEAGTLENWSRDGTNRWVHHVGFPIASAPVVAKDGLVVFSAFDGKLHATRADGQPAWTYDTPALLDRTAAIAPDGTIVVPVQSRIIALRPDGTLRWSHTAEGNTSSPCIGPDGSVYFGVTDATDPTKAPAGRVVALRPDGSVTWNIGVPAPVTASPSLAADGVLFAASGPEMFSLNPNGTWRSRHAAQGQVSAATIGFDGTLYFTDSVGVLTALGGTAAMPNHGWPMAGRDVRQRSDASTAPDPDEFFFPAASNGFDGPVNSIAAAPEGLYVSGDFSIAGGRPADRVAFWNRTNWFACAGRPAGTVSQVITVGTSMFARGEFSNAPGTPPHRVLRWDGLNWHFADDGLEELRGPLARQDNALFTIGSTQGQVEPNSIYLLRYDGTRWTPVGSPLPAQFVHSLRGGPGGFLATAGSRVYRFIDNAWLPLGPSLREEVYVALETPLGIFAGGNFHSEATQSGYIARWNGTAWVGVGTGLGQTTGVFGSAFLMASRGNELLVGGFFNQAGSTNAPGLARWDGTNWSGVLAMGFVSTESSGGPAALEVQGDSIFLGGSFLRLNGDSNLRYFAAFDGATWSALGPKLVFLDGQLQLTLFNYLGRPYAVEVSSDLKTWSQLYLYSNLAKPVSVPVPPDIGGNSRFIRVVVP